mgnify:CR=1 FL=1
MKNKHAGSGFDDFLQEEGLLAETEAVALKRVLAYQRIGNLRNLNPDLNLTRKSPSSFPSW